MQRRYPIFIFLLLFALLIACSTDKSDQPPVTALSPAPALTGDMSSGEVAEREQQPSPISSATPESQAILEPASPDAEISGSLFYIDYRVGGPVLMALDLASGIETVIFTPPEKAWLSELALSPDGSQLLLAYSPPPEEGQVQYGFTDLYLMPADGSATPTPFLEGEDSSESYFNISWPVDDFIYYAHFIPTIAEDGLIIYGSQVERLHIPGATVEQLAPGAAWPRVSDDGALLAYVTDANELMVSGADGSDPRLLVDPDAFGAVDAPLFSPENQLLCFSAVEHDSASSVSFLSRLLGLKIAYAHNVPSDWWCMPLDGSSEAVRLTNLDGIGLYGDFSIDGRHLAFLTADGIYLMSADGSSLRQLQESAPAGTINWTP